MAAELDALDQLVADVFDGYVVRKDLAQKFKGNYPVPTYVAEFLIGNAVPQPMKTRSKKGLRSSSASLANASSVQGSKNSTKRRQKSTAASKSSTSSPPDSMQDQTRSLPRSPLSS